MPVFIKNQDISVNKLTFPAGEIHIQLDNLPEEISGSVDIRADIHNSDDLLALLLIHNALQNHYGDKLVINLEIPYFPYARQDRVCAMGQAFSLQVMARMINSLELNSLMVWDVHSPITQKLTKAVSISQDVIIEACDKLVSHLKNQKTLLVCPDEGAKSKCQAVKERLFVNELVFARKTRNPESGEITDTQLETGDLSGRTAVIIDDICDGGRSFIEIAKKLREKNVERIILYVTHGIFSQGLEVFDGLIDEIYTSNSFPQRESPKLHVIDFQQQQAGGEPYEL
jgi:ribose-phosphate pyrophosphokinase